MQPDNARHCINGNNLISMNMIKVNLGGCSSFVKDADYSKYVGKALDAFDVLQNESGAGNDFLGWKTLPVDVTEDIISGCEAVRDSW